MDKKNLEYRVFLAHEGLELVAYLGDELHDWSLADGFLDSCFAEFNQLDEYHLVYAIEFGAQHDPERFAPLIARRLADQRTSVWCAAHNALLRMPSIRPAVFEDVQRYAKRCPDKNLAEFLEQMKQKAG